MLGMIGATIFGIVAVGAWISEENREEQARNHAKSINSKYYFDKDGKMRWIKNNKKLTSNEIHDTFWNTEGNEKKQEYHHKEYWGVNNLLNGDLYSYTLELFLTKEEANEYKHNLLKEINQIVLKNPDKHENIKLDIRKRHISVSSYTQRRLDLIANEKTADIRINKHF